MSPVVCSHNCKQRIDETWVQASIIRQLATITPHNRRAVRPATFCVAHPNCAACVGVLAERGFTAGQPGVINGCGIGPVCNRKVARSGVGSGGNGTCPTYRKRRPGRLLAQPCGDCSHPSRRSGPGYQPPSPRGAGTETPGCWIAASRLWKNSCECSGAAVVSKAAPVALEAGEPAARRDSAGTSRSAQCDGRKRSNSETGQPHPNHLAVSYAAT
jgi:hypothetical protein